MPKTFSAGQLAAGLCAALFLSAFIAAPHACNGGLEAYFAAGVVVLVLAAAAPFLRRFRSPARSPGWQAWLAAVAVAGTWIAGLFAADVRILCRLF